MLQPCPGVLVVKLVTADDPGAGQSGWPGSGVKREIQWSVERVWS
jgi:hypothetical protein